MLAVFLARIYFLNQCVKFNQTSVDFGCIMISRRDLKVLVKDGLGMLWKALTSLDQT